MRRRASGLLVAMAVLGGGCGDGLELAAPSLFVQALRPDDPASEELFRFDTGDVVEHHDSTGGSFRVHYTLSGAHAVPATDGDSSGIPDFVELVADTYDEVLAYYAGTLGFLPPLSDAGLPAARNGGDGRFDVYLLDFALQSDGAFQLDGCLQDEPDRCVGYMVQENDFAGYGYPSRAVAVRTLASHELFHAVQAAYDAAQGGVLSEGSAVWATECFDPHLDDFEWFISGYLSEPTRSLDLPPPGPVQPFAYGSAIFFRFLEERFGGPQVVRGLWELLPDGTGGVVDPYWLEALDPWLESEHQSGFAAAFVEFATWNLRTARRAEPGQGYAEAATYPAVAVTGAPAPLLVERPRLFYASTSYWALPPGSRAAMTAALVGPAEELAGLRLLLAVERGSLYDEVIEIPDPAAGTTSADTSGATSLVVAVVNTSTSGTSRRPSLCAGTPDEVAACRLALAGSDEAPDAEPAANAAGCGCAGTGSPAWLAIVALAWRRRRMGQPSGGAVP